MKNVFKNALLVLLLCKGLMMEATENIEVEVLDHLNLKVGLTRSEKGDVLLLIDTFGKVLFKDSIGITKSYQRTLNFELVSNGTYHLNLDKEHSLLLTRIKKTKTGLEIDQLAGFVFKPCFKIENRKVKVFLSNPQKMKTKIEVYDTHGVLVGSINSRDLVVKKTLDFSQSPSGIYSVEIKINDQKFSEELKII